MSVLPDNTSDNLTYRIDDPCPFRGADGAASFRRAGLKSCALKYAGHSGARVLIIRERETKDRTRASERADPRSDRSCAHHRALHAHFYTRD
jgi:hypothetical protein